MIWRGNVQTRKTVLIDRVLGPAYSEIRHSRETLESWKANANELALSTPFLKQVESEWRYYTLDQGLRAELESLRSSIAVLEHQVSLSKSVAVSVIREAALKVFEVQNPSTILPLDLSLLVGWSGSR